VILAHDYTQIPDPAEEGEREEMEIETPRGAARVELTRPKGRVSSLLALGHGAGADVGTADLVAVRDAALAAGVAVALVTQPYRVAGRRAPAPAPQLDEAWLAVLAHLAATSKIKAPLVVGGRSSGARVACRTAKDSGAAGVVALAFPLHPPGKPEKSRDGELATGVPTLVVNGDRDAFGVPAARPGVDLVVLPGQTHDLRKDPAAVANAVVGWLRSHEWARSR
jgi:predicted alpha/beta-hydrolase family hydrolase